MEPWVRGALQGMGIAVATFSIFLWAWAAVRDFLEQGSQGLPWEVIGLVISAVLLSIGVRRPPPSDKQ